MNKTKSPGYGMLAFLKVTSSLNLSYSGDSILLFYNIKFCYFAICYFAIFYLSILFCYFAYCDRIASGVRRT